MEGEAIPMVSYKYLDCVVDEYLELKEMVGDKVESGRRSLSPEMLGKYWRCRSWRFSEIDGLSCGVRYDAWARGLRYGVALDVFIITQH